MVHIYPVIVLLISESIIPVGVTKGPPNDTQLPGTGEYWINPESDTQ